MEIDRSEMVEDFKDQSSEETLKKAKEAYKKHVKIGDDDESLSLPGAQLLTLNFGPQHPATHGTLRMVMQLDGETIVNLDPSPGYLHTGFEKLAEHHTFNQFIAVTDRMNYLSPMSNNIGFAQAAEKLLGITLTERAQYIRMIQGELSRIADHLVNIGTHALDLGAFTVFLYTFRQREFIYDLFEESTGSRLTTSYTRIGGVVRDFSEDHPRHIAQWCKQFKATCTDQVEGLLNHNKIFLDRTQNVGKISAEDAINCGMTGPCLRASGVATDIRKDEPYLKYDEVDFDVPIGTEGDVYERYLVRMEEMKQSIRIIEQCLERMKPGPVKVADHTIALPDKNKVYGSIEGLIHHFKLIMDQHGIAMPKGEIYDATEAPNGELGWYIVSNGEGTPYKVHVRAPSFIHFGMMSHMAKGGLIGDAVAILGSMNVIAGECDR
ncbi:MAG TPA: NADH dehydrogenase (quinone) subunit D [bacterium]|nr:NADH dehydrogenase (quinone) subunit D [bacterium]